MDKKYAIDDSLQFVFNYCRLFVFGLFSVNVTLKFNFKHCQQTNIWQFKFPITYKRWKMIITFFVVVVVVSNSFISKPDKIIIFTSYCPYSQWPKKKDNLFFFNTFNFFFMCTFIEYYSYWIHVDKKWLLQIDYNNTKYII